MRVRPDIAASMNFGLTYVVLGLLLVGAAVLGGAVLAMLAKRMNPMLPFRRLWVFYSALLAFAVAAILAIGIL